MQSGRWYDLTKRAADEKAWKEQNAHILKEDPTLYNRIYDRYMQEHEDLGRKYAEEGVSSWRVLWQAIVPKPNLTLDQMLNAYSLAKENMWDEQRGMYIYKNTEISEEEAGRIALNSLLSDANFYGYAAQQARLGDKGYLNDEGEIIPPMIIDSHGRPQWNPRSAFAPDLQLVQDIIAHKQQHITPDQVKIAASAPAEVIAVKVRIAKGMHKIAGAIAAYLCDHHRQQRVGSDTICYTLKNILKLYFDL